MMRRKSTRNSAKTSDEISAPTKKPDTPRKPTRSSRRIRSRSRSVEELEGEENVKSRLETIEESKVDEHNTSTQCENNGQAETEQKNNHEEISEQTETVLRENEEVVEEHQAEVNENTEEQGKSKELTNTQDVESSQSSNNIEPDTENEHVQGTPQSPPIDNADKNDTQLEDTKVEQEADAKTEDNFQSENVQDTDTPNKGEDSNTGDKLEERSLTPEIKERKKITLKRLTSDKMEEDHPTEDVHVVKEHNDELKESTNKKITLKRRLSISEKSDEPSSHTDSVDVAESGCSRRLSTSKEEETRRPSSHTEEKSLKVEVKQRKPSKKIRLIRNFSQETKTDEESSSESKPHRRNSTCRSEWLEKITETLYKIDVDSIKIVCPTVKFLKEEEVKLESVPPRERYKSESSETVSKRKLSTDEGEIKDTSDDHLSDSSVMAVNRNISIVEEKEGASELSPTKPPPSPAHNPTSTVLYITNLVRPFTIKQLRELLEKTGTIEQEGFWTDRIKSKCYVRYTSIEEADVTRNALHGEFWPVGNGKKLKVEFSTLEEMDKVMNPPTIVVADIVPEKENREPEKEDNFRVSESEKPAKKRDAPVREWDIGKEEQRRRSRTRTPSKERGRKHSRRSYTPEIPTKKKSKRSEEEPVPQKLMDDLFLKTKATPSIYWQPLSPEEIAKKIHQRLVRMEEHKRRIEETRERARDNRRPAYRRR